MSIKTVHLIFIVAATLLFLGVALWAFLFSRMEWEVLLLGALSGLVAIALPAYAVYFYKKSKLLSS